jgi:hypothetical protein
MKLILPLIIAFFCFCGNTPEDVKSQKANNLYDRICSMVYLSSNSGYTTEWENIKNNILENKDTLFMMNGNDFQILVKRTPYTEIDTTKKQVKTESGGSWR